MFAPFSNAHNAMETKQRVDEQAGAMRAGYTVPFDYQQPAVVSWARMPTDRASGNSLPAAFASSSEAVRKTRAGSTESLRN